MLNHLLKLLILIAPLLFLSGFSSSLVQAQGQEINWQPFEKAINKARSTKKPILVDVWAPWCGWCHKMEKDVYPALVSTLKENFLLTRINRDNHKATYQYNGQRYSAIRLTQKFKIQSVPGLVFLSEEGQYLLHISGFISANKLRPILLWISSKSYQEQSYADFISQHKH
ncbi:Thioredoxin-related protein [Fodinibius salinus]|uniref:Thioredoxin-related protein n=1 Tax=Fodinibius salinus TaxID=860790 RepID=A0A5D3YGP1_9BACT|nr:thioredoxin family protein [Fodinibius salinus]TYP92173.1 Thioredoxin-related protein [Fodinibius salinus]